MIECVKSCYLVLRWIEMNSRYNEVKTASVCNTKIGFCLTDGQLKSLE